MRAKRTTQTSLFDPQALDHPVADELEWASAWLDEHPELLDEVAADLAGKASTRRGRHGLTRETILRCAVLLHLRGESYRGLAFTLQDSLSAQRFARLDPARPPPGKSVLQATVGSVGAATWEAINRRLLEVARAERIETGEAVRVDSTVTETHILEPSDSRLLVDGVRVLTRLLRAARGELGAVAVDFHDHRRAAKRRALEAGSQRGAARRARTYRKLGWPGARWATSRRRCRRWRRRARRGAARGSAARRPISICWAGWRSRPNGGCSAARRCRLARR